VLDRETPAGEPQNYLIVGVDSAERLGDDDPVRRGRDSLNRSDTIMVLRIDPGSRQAALLSLPRDLWVPIAGTGSNQRINTTIERGGPELLIRTIDEYLGISIHHYVQVDFAAFQGLVEAVGGVPVWVPRPARDRAVGLDLPERGCVTLDPEQALAYVRSRHYEELIDGDWEEDARSDLGRIERQQDFIRRSLGRAIDRGARDPGRLDQLIDVGLVGVTVDDALTADDIFRLGNRFRSFEPSELVSYAVPTDDDTVGEADILRLAEDEAEPVLDIFRGTPEVTAGDEGDGGEEIPPESVRVQVLNGSGQTGEASATAVELAEAGFGVSGTGEAATFDYVRTVVQHPPGQRAEAEALARWLEAGAELEEVADASGIVLVTGADWEGVRSSPRPGDDPSSDATDTTGTGGTATTGLGTAPTTGSTTGTGDTGGDGDGSDGGSGSGSTRSTTTTVDPASRRC
jgi:LCP family protein required for cell wall assembly